MSEAGAATRGRLRCGCDSTRCGAVVVTAVPFVFPFPLEEEESVLFGATVTVVVVALRVALLLAVVLTLMRREARRVARAGATTGVGAVTAVGATAVPSVGCIGEAFPLTGDSPTFAILAIGGTVIVAGEEESIVDVGLPPLPPLKKDWAPGYTTDGFRLVAPDSGLDPDPAVDPDPGPARNECGDAALTNDNPGVNVELVKELTGAGDGAIGAVLSAIPRVTSDGCTLLLGRAPVVTTAGGC